MTTAVFVNFPVSNLQDSTAFYQALGFKKNDDFSNEESSAMVWDGNFFVMLLTHNFYRKFLDHKEIPDTKLKSGALISFSMENADAVKQFAETAKANGGNFYELDMDIPEEHMFQLEVVDLDGNNLEPFWMDSLPALP
ncbi:VOC family protein [Enterococcus sp. AZ072]|uniref:VOC family protein n=1 Tax=unclassified Enterococcus TaxID=2608891 RepID=UPI003D27ED6A